MSYVIFFGREGCSDVREEKMLHCIVEVYFANVFWHSSWRSTIIMFEKELSKEQKLSKTQMSSPSHESKAEHMKEKVDGILHHDHKKHDGANAGKKHQEESGGEKFEDNAKKYLAEDRKEVSEGKEYGGLM
ncbi:hypothetical protein HII31_12775 [Pseudocercospora fuligena]|uniref:Uncharacterized protein n=1 Tax=Pseudocercospora fuligena TaxID=685502 RepID=A0A8H6R8T2_9PEZI|nr:hypothetical protein HII31_12775 [Pseudocercospora fuligena]